MPPSTSSTGNTGNTMVKLGYLRRNTNAHPVAQASGTETTDEQDRSAPAVTSTSAVGRWRGILRRGAAEKEGDDGGSELGEERPAKWSFGVLNDKRTAEVPGESLAFGFYGS
jgi:hypothetical protein